jgi:hypothetical protein
MFVGLKGLVDTVKVGGGLDENKICLTYVSVIEVCFFVFWALFFLLLCEVYTRRRGKQNKIRF